jgi:hypothetical protein
LKRLVATLLIALPVLVAPPPAFPQITLGLRYGEGNGSAKYTVGEATARVRLAERFSVNGLYQIIGGHWACTGGALEELRCDYDGYSISLGASYAAYDGPAGFLGLGVALGQFKRTGGREYARRWRYTASISVDGEVDVWGPFRLLGGITHRRISDEGYVRTFSERPHLTSFTGGIGITLWP